MISILSVIISNGIPDHPSAILLTEDGAYVCIDLDEDDEVVDGWVSSVDIVDYAGLSLDTEPDGVIVMTDEHNVVATCSGEDFIGLVEVDQTLGLLDIHVLWQALGDLRRERATCPQTCGE